MAERLLDPAVQRDPFGYYRQLREGAPVSLMPGTRPSTPGTAAC